ncbi:hypothetical protein BS78_06G284900 [Paspalum vaginatum]|nr:hypothetical protein BS78_06G284900 [Paspalum vaginatum]
MPPVKQTRTDVRRSQSPANPVQYPMPNLSSETLSSIRCQTSLAKRHLNRRWSHDSDSRPHIQQFSRASSPCRRRRSAVQCLLRSARHTMSALMLSTRVRTLSRRALEFRPRTFQERNLMLSMDLINEHRAADQPFRRSQLQSGVACGV